jgi:hypothetical protein
VAAVAAEAGVRVEVVLRWLSCLQLVSVDEPVGLTPRLRWWSLEQMQAQGLGGQGPGCQVGQRSSQLSCRALRKCLRTSRPNRSRIQEPHRTMLTRRTLPNSMGIRRRTVV